MTSFDRAALDAADAATWLRLASCGDFAGAWEISDRIMHRRQWCTDPRAPRHLQTIWNGTPLNDRRVLIRCYHGLGDTIQFIRYAAAVKRIAREVIVWAQPQLLPLLAPVAGIDRLLALHDGTPDVAYDVDLEIMELPYVFRTTISTIPSDVPYLHTEPAVFPDDGARRVGLIWRAGGWNPGRSIPFDAFEGLLAVPGVRWYQLQYGIAAEERRPNVAAFGEATIPELARCMAAMDLVISIDSMPAHLAGALGVPVWTLLPADADWRWMKNRRDSPWYPTMRLFRQDVAGGWGAVVRELGEALISWISRT